MTDIQGDQDHNVMWPAEARKRQELGDGAIAPANPFTQAPDELNILLSDGKCLGSPTLHPRHVTLTGSM